MQKAKLMSFAEIIIQLTREYIVQHYIGNRNDGRCAVGAKMTSAEDQEYEQLMKMVTDFYDANKDDGHGMSFKTYPEWERKQLISEGVKAYRENGYLRIREKYLVIGGFNTINESGEWEKR